MTLAACGPSASLDEGTLATNTIPGVVTWITDGDTIEVETDDGEVTVRLIGMNAPDHEECFYQEALDHLIDTLRDRDVMLELFGVDQFDRVLAHVHEGDRHINYEIVAQGLSIATTPEERDPHGDAMLAGEEQAFTAGEGLWASMACGAATSQNTMVEFDIDMSVPDPPGPDDEVLENEVITLVASSADEVDLSGWILRDESSRHRYVFPGGMVLPAGAALTVTSRDRGWSPGGESVWNNSGDMALLQDPNGTVVSRWRY